MNTYTYSGTPKPSPLMAEKLLVMVPLCLEHSQNRPATFSLEGLKRYQSAAMPLGAG